MRREKILFVRQQKHVSYSYMKKLWTKNTLIAALLLTNTVAFGYILATKYNLKEALLRLAHKLPANEQAAKEPAKKKGQVDEAGYFKGDNDLQACYENFLTREPAIEEGAVLFHWTIEANGSVNNLKLVKSDFNDDSFTACLKDKIQDMKMSTNKAPQGTIIAHTFKFKRKTLDRADFHASSE